MTYTKDEDGQHRQAINIRLRLTSDELFNFNLRAKRNGYYDLCEWLADRMKTNIDSIVELLPLESEEGMTYELEDKIAFGKYVGSTIEEIIDDDPSYLEWALDEVDGFGLSDKALEALEVALGQDNPTERLFYQPAAK